MLDIFNNLIQYQYAGCPDLIYAILRRSKLFYSVTKIPDFLDNALASRKSDNGKKFDARPVAQQVVDEVKKKEGDDPPTRDPPAPKLDSARSQKETKDEMKGTEKARKKQSDGRKPPEPAEASESATVKLFRPSKQWMISWQRKLPLGTVLRLIEFMLPKLHERASNE